MVIRYGYQVPSLFKLPDGLSSHVMEALVSSLATKLAVSVLDCNNILLFL